MAVMAKTLIIIQLNCYLTPSQPEARLWKQHESPRNALLTRGTRLNNNGTLYLGWKNSACSTRIKLNEEILFIIILLIRAYLDINCSELLIKKNTKMKYYA